MEEIIFENRVFESRKANLLERIAISNRYSSISCNNDGFKLKPKNDIHIIGKYRYHSENYNGEKATTLECPYCKKSMQVSLEDFYISPEGKRLGNIVIEDGM